MPRSASCRKPSNLPPAKGTAIMAKSAKRKNNRKRGAAGSSVGNIHPLIAQAAGKAPVPSADGATDLIPIIGDYVLTGDEAANDIIEMAPLQIGRAHV